MAVPTISWRPPESFVSGDSLIFNQRLPNYLPSSGFAIRLTLTKNTPNGAEKVDEVVSTPDVTNAFHQFNETSFGAGLDSGNYVLSEEVFNAGTGERHQIYFADNFQIGADLADGLATAPVQTDAQIILAGLYDTYKQLLKLKFAETEDLRSRFRLQDQSKILEDIKYWKSVCINEMQIGRSRNGQRPGNVQDAVFYIG